MKTVLGLSLPLLMALFIDTSQPLAYRQLLLAVHHHFVTSKDLFAYLGISITKTPTQALAHHMCELLRLWVRLNTFDFLSPFNEGDVPPLNELLLFLEKNYTLDALPLVRSELKQAEIELSNVFKNVAKPVTDVRLNVVPALPNGVR